MTPHAAPLTSAGRGNTSRAMAKPTARAINQAEGVDLCYALAVRRQARRVSRLYDRHLAPAGLSVSQLTILFLLHTHERLKVAALADILVMERTSLVRALKPLQAAGWVVAKRPDGGRAFDLALSEAGARKLDQARPLWKNAQAAFEREVGRERAIRFRDEMRDLECPLASAPAAARSLSRYRARPR